ncbi:MAG: glycosyltransferase family 4 protein [Acidobacteriota bacterium]|nr:glycosyltransferase family 4 protein [Acidobacteriota bacterium]
MTTIAASDATNKLAAFVGGSIGSDPYSHTTWSGLMVHLLPALERAGCLQQALSVKVPPLHNSLLLAKNFARDRGVWRKHYYFDPAYRAALTRAAGRLPLQAQVCLQIGMMMSLPEVFPTHPCMAYNDGNLAELLDSGFGLQGVSARRIDQAMRYEQEVAQRLDRVLTFSEHLRQSFIHNYHLDPARVIVVGAGINLSSLPPENPDKRYDTPRILFVGKEFERKGGLVLLQAFRAVRAALPTAELHIAGPLSLPEVPEGVVFHGHLSKADPQQRAKLEQLYRESTLFTLPSLYEPFGIAPLEAMLFQLPCVVTRAWALQEMVTPGFNGDLAEKGSAEDLATKLIALLREPDQLREMGKRGRQMVLERYTWETVGANFRAVLNGLT